MNALREVVNGTLGVQVAKSAAMEIQAAKEAWKELSSVKALGQTSLYDIAQDANVAFMDASVWSVGIDRGMLSSLRNNLEKLGKQEEVTSQQIEAMEAIAKAETSRAEAAEAELFAARRELLDCRRDVLRTALLDPSAVAVVGIPVDTTHGQAS